MAQKIHFIGIAGVGMSALAQLLKREGKEVTGTDNAWFPTLEAVEKLGIPVTMGYDPKNLPEGTDVVVHTDAAHPDNVERLEAKRRGIPDHSYFEMLGQVSIGRRTVAVAGTHGKTTTTGMLTKILADGSASPTAIVGSIVKDFHSNYLHGDSSLFVVEACEYKDHLLELSPEVLVITNLEWDHTDYFPSLEALQETFKKAISRVPAHGFIVTDTKNINIAPLLGAAKAKVVDYTGEEVPNLKLPGEFNKANARAAAAAARVVAPSITNDSLATSLSHFHGTWRRFEYKGKTKNGAEVYDDYAHHPTAIQETLRALRARTKGKIFVAFHPHLYSRTKDLFAAFATSFADADEVLIAPIYAAREKDDGTISSELLARRVKENGANAHAATFEEIETEFAATPQTGDVIMTMGAGDIFKIADALVQKLGNKLT